MSTGSRFKDRMPVTAAAARTAGVPVIEDGLHGFPVVDAGTGEEYALDIESKVRDIALIASSAVGDIVDMNVTTFALTRRARSAAAPVGTRPVAQVVRLAGNAGTNSPTTGRMWVLWYPQTPAPTTT